MCSIDLKIESYDPLNVHVRCLEKGFVKDFMKRNSTILKQRGCSCEAEWYVYQELAADQVEY